MSIVGMIAFPTSSVARKLLIAISGLLIIGFLFFHLAGNLYLFQGQAAFNGYVQKLESFGWLIYMGEAALGALFLYHAVQGIRIAMLNSAARKHSYAEKQRLGKGSLASLSMPISGTIILIFLIIHIWNFRLQKDSLHLESGHADLYTVVVNTFQNPAYVCLYIVAMLCVGLHLAHAFQSSLRTLGLTQPSWLNLGRQVGLGLAVFFTVSFSAFPVYFLAQGTPTPGVKGYETPIEIQNEADLVRDVEHKLGQPGTPAPTH